MTKVAHYLPVYLPLTETWLYWQIAQLRAFESIALCRRIENIDQFPAKGIFSFRECLPAPIRFYYRIRHPIDFYLSYYEKIVKSERPSLVHAHFGHLGYEALSLTRKLGLPLVTSFYGADASRLIKTEPAWIDKYKTLFSEGKAFIAEGSHMESTLEGLGCPREKINVLRLGVDLNKLPYKERCPDGEIRVLAAGTFREKKGHPFTVEAVGLVARKHPNISLTIIGDAAAHRPREVEEKKKILTAIERAGLAGRTRLLGFQPYDAFIRELLNHHIFVSPSVQAADGDNEGGAPVSITEASATGMPVLSTTHCDIPEVVLDGKSGYLVPERAANALAERLSFLIENPQTWPTLGACGRAHIEERYDLRKQVPKLERVYHGVLANSTESSREA